MALWGEPRCFADSPTISPSQIDALVDQLGDPLWRVREDAQEQLLDHGRLVTKRLRDALRSDNLELAYRSASLLDRLDPRLAHFQIIRVRIGDEPEIVSSHYASGPAHTDISLKPHGLQSDKSSPNLFGYELSFTTREGSHLEITVDRVRTGYRSETRLDPPLSAARGISLLAYTEQSSVARLGTLVKRQRVQFITLLRVRYGRLSEMARTEIIGTSATLLETLTDELKEQTRSQAAPEHIAALSVLSFVAPGQPLVEFNRAMSKTNTRPLGVLGLDRLKSLHEELQRLKRSSPPRRATPQRKTSIPAPPVRLAARLAERGADEGTRWLLHRLAETEPEQLYFVAASLADALSLHPPTAETRRLALQTILSERFLTRAVWEDPATGYLLAVAARIADPHNETDANQLRVGMAVLERLTTGRVASKPLPLMTCLGTWRDLAHRLDPQPSEREFLFRVLPSLLKENMSSSVRNLIEAATQESSLTDSELASLLQALANPGQGHDQTRYRLFVRLLSSLQIGPGQLQPLVTAVLKVGNELTVAGLPTGTRKGYLTQVANHLETLTGMDSGWNPQSKFVPEWQRWTSWLEDSASVLERETQILQQNASNSRPEPGRFVLYEFDLRVDQIRSGANALEREPSTFEVLDGRRSILRTEERHTSQDRWGHPVHRTLRRPVRPTQGIKVKAVKKPQRFRLTRTSPILTVGTPVLGPVLGRETENRRYETSGLYYGPKPMTQPNSSQFHSLYLLLPFDPNELEKTSPDALWKRVIRDHVLNLTHVNSDSARRSLLNLLGTLRLEDDLTFLQACFEKQPTAGLARQLYLRGDTTGVQYYRSTLPSLKELPYFMALKFLVSVGDSTAMRALIKMAQTRTSFVSGYRRGQALSVLTAFLRQSQSESDKLKVLEFFVRQAENPGGRGKHLTQVFRALEAESGTDFGYPSARATNDPAERKRALARSAQEAHEWLAARKKGR